MIALSNASVYPEGTAHAFRHAQKLGYDGLEVMVGIDAISQNPEAVKQLSDHHGVPVVAIHSPCLLFTQRVWGNEPWAKLQRSAEMADLLGAEVVVVHPPFRWQRDYAMTFIDGVASLESSTGIKFAVENMYPWRAARGRGIEMYLPGSDPTDEHYDNMTLDVSHASVAGVDPVDLALRMGGNLRHVHLTDGTGSAKDEHLVPGRGNARPAELMEYLRKVNFEGHIAVEINTRRCASPSERERDLADSLAFARDFGF